METSESTAQAAPPDGWLIERQGLARVLMADGACVCLLGLLPEASSAPIPCGIYTRAASDQTLDRLPDVARIALQAGQPLAAMPNMP